MQTFFHGWRRKVGVVALVMALAFQIALLRGSFVEDVFRYDISDGDFVEVRFEDRTIECGYHWGMWIDMGLIPPSDEFNWVTFPVRDCNTHERLFCFDHWSETIGDISLRIPDIPAIAMLTVISAYLLLWKLRKRG